MDATDKNKWIEETLGSFEGMQKAEPSPFLYGKIEHRISAAGSTIKLVPLRTVYLTAACVLLLVMFNILFLSMRHVSADRSIQQVAEYYQLTNNNPLYSL